MAKKCKNLEEIKAMFKDVEIDLDQIGTYELQNFMIIFKEQNDTRIQGKVKHLMSDIIMISFWQYLQDVMDGMKLQCLRYQKKNG